MTRPYAIIVSGLLLMGALPATAAGAAAASPIGEAFAAKVAVQHATSIIGATTSALAAVLAGTGTLSGADFALAASNPVARIPALLSADTLHATTVDSDDGTGEQVSSQASLANLVLHAGGNIVRVAYAMALAYAPRDGRPTGASDVEGILVNGDPVPVTGRPNQIVAIPGGELVLNGRHIGPDGAIVVDAIRVIVPSTGNLTIASATAGLGKAA